LEGENTFTLFDQQDISPLIEKSESSWVILLFTASWLGSSHILEEFIHAIFFEHPDQALHLYKVDIEENQAVAEKMNVSQLPTVVILHQREFKDYFTGLLSKKKLYRKFEKLGMLKAE